jgi:hypothetical protein
MKLVELEVEERLKLRRQSEIEEAEKMAQKDGRLPRPERISTPVEPDSTVAGDSVNDKHSSSDNEVDSSESETSVAKHVDSSMDDGEVVSDSSFKKTHEPGGKRTRKRKHSGEDYLTSVELDSIGKTGRSDVAGEHVSIAVANKCTASGQVCSNTNWGTQGIVPSSGLGVPVVYATSAAKLSTNSQGIKYRPWMEFEMSNPSEVQNTNTRIFSEDEPKMARPWQNYPSGVTINGKQQTDVEQLTKRHKNRPQPIEIPPDKGIGGASGVSYPSWLRSPCLRGDASVLPYTPPPMLSPSRNGAGLFWTVNQVAPTPAVKHSGVTTSSRPGWLAVHENAAR